VPRRWPRRQRRRGCASSSSSCASCGASCAAGRPALGDRRARCRAGGRAAAPPPLRGAPPPRDLPAVTAIVMASPRRAFAAAASGGVCSVLALLLLQRKAPAAEFKRPNQFSAGSFALATHPPNYSRRAQRSRPAPRSFFFACSGSGQRSGGRPPRALDGSARALAIIDRHPLQSEWRLPRWARVSFRGAGPDGAAGGVAGAGAAAVAAVGEWQRHHRPPPPPVSGGRRLQRPRRLRVTAEVVAQWIERPFPGAGPSPQGS
jgi:hypothetical protein